MIEMDEQLQSLMEQAERRERLARRNAILYTLLPILFAIALLSMTAWQVQNASQQVAQKNAELETASNALETSQDEFTALSQKMNDAEKSLEKTQITLTLVSGQLDEKQAQLGVISQTLAQSQTQINQLQEQLSISRTQLVQLDAQLSISQTLLVSATQAFSDLQKQVNELNDQLLLASRFKEFYVEGNIYEVTKDISGYTWDLERAAETAAGTAALFDQLISLIEVPWKINGTSFDEGVNSPTFAALVLNLFPEPLNASIDQATLMQYFPAQQEEPRIGDLVYYAEGITLFYFRSQDGQGVVFGMTPVGIVLLKYEFAEPIGVGRVFP